MRLNAVVLIVAAMMVGAAACTAGADMTGSLASRVSSWVQASGYSASHATISDDVSRIGVARRRGDLLGLKTECAGLSTDVQQAYSNLPSPDGSLTDSLSRAYTAYASSAQDCYSGASNRDQRRLAVAQETLSRANSYLDEADRRIQAIGVRS